jgi:hypothetical protein
MDSDRGGAVSVAEVDLLDLPERTSTQKLLSVAASEEFSWPLRLPELNEIHDKCEEDIIEYDPNGIIF